LNTFTDKIVQMEK